MTPKAALKIIEGLPARQDAKERVLNIGPLETDNKKLLQSGMSVFDEILKDEEHAKLMTNLKQINRFFKNR